MLSSRIVKRKAQGADEAKKTKKGNEILRFQYQFYSVWTVSSRPIYFLLSSTPSFRVVPNMLLLPLALLSPSVSFVLSLPATRFLLSSGIQPRFIPPTIPLSPPQSPDPLPRISGACVRALLQTLVGIFRAREKASQYKQSRVSASRRRRLLLRFLSSSFLRSLWRTDSKERWAFGEWRQQCIHESEERGSGGPRLAWESRVLTFLSVSPADRNWL